MFHVKHSGMKWSSFLYHLRRAQLPSRTFPHLTLFAQIFAPARKRHVGTAYGKNSAHSPSKFHHFKTPDATFYENPGLSNDLLAIHNINAMFHVKHRRRRRNAERQEAPVIGLPPCAAAAVSFTKYLPILTEIHPSHHLQTFFRLPVLRF